MTVQEIGTFTTNTVKDSKVSVKFPCAGLWAQGQLRAIKLLTVKKRGLLRADYDGLVDDFSTRAARIAAAYARFYLELEPGCNPELKGRFYWMGLAAFASKQVMCGLDFVKSAGNFISNVEVPVSKAEQVGYASQAVMNVPFSIPKNSLGKGNFWLFQDIYVWHWFYANYPDLFDECSAERNVSTYPDVAKRALNELPWAEETLPVINNFGVTGFVTKGFASIGATEKEADFTERRQYQMSSLLAIADHEQRKILQPLIYEDVIFQRVLDIQEKMEFVPWLPKRLAAFSTACDVEDERLKVQMTEGHLYDENDRMKFIKEIAKKYHDLMGNKTEYMEQEISSIATWANYT